MKKRSGGGRRCSYRRLAVATVTALSVVSMVFLPLVLSSGASAQEQAETVLPGGGTPRVMGLQRSAPGNYPSFRVSSSNVRDLPSSYDLTMEGLPIGNQGSSASCVGWAVGYYFKTYQEGLEHGWDVSLKGRRFSPSWVYNQACEGEDQGTTFPEALDVLESKGIVDIEEFPFKDSDVETMPSRRQLQAAKPYRITDYAAIWMSPGGNDVTSVKSLLASGEPVLLGIPVYESFYNDGDGWIDVPRAQEDCYGGHALCAVGYDDGAGGGRGGVKIVNSWGDSWGDEGSAYLSYEFVSDWVWEAWTMTDSASDLPEVNSFSTESGRPGDTVAISGDNFGTDRGESGVLFKNAGATVISWHNESIKVKIPEGAVDGAVRVVNWAGERSGGIDFDVGHYVTVVSPGIARTAEEVTVYGAEFGSEPGEVRLGGDAVEVMAWTEKEILFRAPAEPARGDMIVYVNGEASRPVEFRAATSVWYLAEGCTGFGFEEWLCLQNPSDEACTVEITYMTPEGDVKKPDIQVPAGSRVTIPVGVDLPDRDVSTMVVSDGRILVERSMYWQERLEGHASSGVPRIRREWFLGEGTTDYGFETWILVQNPNSHDATVNITYLTPDGPVAREAFTVGARSRSTVFANLDIAGDISVKVESSLGVVVERSMYWGEKRGGHNSTAVPEPSTNWFLAEGSTLFGFDEWVMLGNPTERDATVRLTYMTPRGPIEGPAVYLPSGTRKTVHMNQEIQAAEVSVRVDSDAPVVAERSVYWNNGTGRAGHCAAGSTESSTTSYLPEGCTAHGFEEWVLIQNPSLEESASVVVRYMTPSGPVDGPRILLEPGSRRSVLVNRDLPCSDVSVEVNSDSPVIVERSMYWGGMGGGHGATGIIIDD